jgi:Na+/H+ antiporter NhaD/arsenite permease-like protein
LRIIAPRPHPSHHASNTKHGSSVKSDKVTLFVRLDFPINFVTAPLIADLFLLAILAIGKAEVHDGTVGANNISPLDIMAFFLSLAYIAISIDASGLIRYLAFKVLQWGGDVGHRLFFYLYLFFFGLTAFIGNDPVILSGTAFLAYMTRVSSNIVHPRAWIHTQFAVANIASAILVSSNPTNLVLAGAFKIRFINYTANIIVPVVATAIVLFPFLLYIVFANESLIPYSIKMHELPEEARGKKPVNPNIPHARGNAEEEEQAAAYDEPSKLLSLEEIMNPFLDKGGAWFGAALMAATLITLLAINAASQTHGEHPVFWVTLPAAFIMLCFDIIMGWRKRKETREIARKGREEYERARAERAIRDEDEVAENLARENGYNLPLIQSPVPEIELPDDSNGNTANGDYEREKPTLSTSSSTGLGITTPTTPQSVAESNEKTHKDTDEKYQQDKQARISHLIAQRKERGPATLTSKCADASQWAQETFPTATTVIAHLPFALVPFAFSMFVLVQALVTKGWVPVFAHGWDHWVNKTGTVGAIGGMGFLSVILCNVSLFSHIITRDTMHSRLLTHPSSQEQTSEQQSSSPVSYKPGNQFIISMVHPSPTGPSGAPFTAWP